MKRIIIFFGLFFVLLMAGCQSELPASSETPVASEREVAEVSKLPDFIEWTKVYLEAGLAVIYGLIFRSVRAEWLKGREA
jgi:hypothetical protein